MPKTDKSDIKDYTMWSRSLVRKIIMVDSIRRLIIKRLEGKIMICEPKTKRVDKRP